MSNRMNQIAGEIELSENLAQLGGATYVLALR